MVTQTGQLDLDTGEYDWWLSFVDTDKSAPLEEQVPGGGGFLGVCIVRSVHMEDAVIKAHELGINPGGEVAGAPAPTWLIPEEYRNRLLSVEESRELDELLLTKLQDISKEDDNGE